MKALIILAPENFRDEEYKVPKDKVEAAGVSVTVAGPSSGLYKGMLGMEVEPDILLDDVRVDDYDAIIVVGGSGSKEHLWNNQKLLEIVREANKKDKVVSAICLSGAVLGNAGILEGKRATVFPAGDAIQILKDNGATYVEEDVVVDGTIITAKGPQAAEEFADKILEALS